MARDVGSCMNSMKDLCEKSGCVYGIQPVVWNREIMGSLDLTYYLSKSPRDSRQLSL